MKLNLAKLAVCAFALLVTWLVMEPTALRHMFDGASFDQDGHSAFELATIPFYVAIIPLVWWKCPFTGSRRRRILLCSAVSCVAFMAIAKELDWHLIAMQNLFPSIVGTDHGAVWRVCGIACLLRRVAFQGFFQTPPGGLEHLLPRWLRRDGGSDGPSSRVVPPHARTGQGRDREQRLRVVLHVL